MLMEDVPLTSQPFQEESPTAPKDLFKKKTESIPLELENKHPLESEMPVTEQASLM